MKAAASNRLLDFRWRFSNLYWIKPAEDEPEILFAPKPEQWEILELIYVHGNTRLAILKSRQLGFSTLLALVCLDWLLFRPGVKIAIVDKKAGDAEKKLGKVRFAWARLPHDLREAYRIGEDNKSVMEITLRKQGDVTRRIEAGESARGDTNQLLWISEWGPIQKEDPKRSDKIADGDLPSADKGLVVVETTWRGGKSGRLYDDIVEPAQKMDPKYKTKRDWHICFYAWWLDKTLVFEGDVAQIPTDCRQYLAKIQKKEKIKFTRGQALWYFKIAWPKREKRYEEYPSTLEEIFLSPEPGAIYADEMAELLAKGRITPLPVVVGVRVWASFDLGRGDAMPVCLIQRIGKEVRVVDYYTNNRENVKHYADYLKAWMERNKVRDLRIILPHDGGRESLETGKTIAGKFEECGMVSPIVVPRINRIWEGIDNVRDLFPYLFINADRCCQVVKHSDQKKFPSLEDCLNRYHSIDMQEGKNIAREPVHDKYSHGADSLRTFAEADEQGLIRNESAPRRKLTVLAGPGVLMAPARKSNKARVVTPFRRN